MLFFIGIVLGFSRIALRELRQALASPPSGASRSQCKYWKSLRACKVTQLQKTSKQVLQRDLKRESGLGRSKQVPKRELPARKASTEQAELF
ncbi:hypothetical protein BBD41_07355 [Paenibacillus ihbetae]|uniref:Uncharacterized protein n=1 Tax=Paenibacillus ihbetae TaxID=1870820 RepID=A0A1B2DXI0_9BACL|nr:hypothetical protein BBD41_07355 [Paenibacillus ihbetae]